MPSPRGCGYEKQILRRLVEMERGECEGKPPHGLKNKNKAKVIRQRGEEPVRQAWYRMSGVDLTAIDARAQEAHYRRQAH